MTKRLLHNENGSALFIALILTALLSLVGIMAMDNSQGEVDLSFNKIGQDKSFYVAEAGLEHAQAMINSNLSWNAGFAAVAFGDGEYSVTVTDSNSNPALADSILLVSSGMIDGARATVEAMVIPEPFHPFEFGLFANESVTIENSVSTDSWNADSGNYSSTVEGAYGSVGSNGTITMENNPTIGGNVFTAQPGGINISGNGQVLGDTSSTAPVLDFSNLINAELINWAESNNQAPLGMSGTFTYNGASRDLYIAGSDKIVLDDGVYVFDDITLEQSALLEVAPGTEVTLLVTGDIDLRNKAMVNSGGKPANFRVYQTGSAFSMGQSSEFTGAVIAPNVDFSLLQYADFYGSLMANRINLANNPEFHYDRSLGNIVMGTTGRMIRVAWREVS